VAWWARTRGWLEDRRARAWLFLGLWFLPPFVLFSACAGKETQYILPLYPPLAMLVGVTLVRWADGELPRWGRALSTVAGYAVGVLLAVAGVGMAAAMASGLAAPRLFGSVPLAAFVAGVAVASGVLALAFWRRRKLAGLLAAVAVAFGAARAFHTTELAAVENATHSPRGLCRRVAELVPQDAPLFLYDLNRPTYSLYAERVATCVPAEDWDRELAPRLRSSAPAFMLVPVETFERLGPEATRALRCELAAHAGDEVLLISNRRDASPDHPPGNR